MAEFCIGTAQFGMEYGIANKTGMPSQKEITRIVSFAIESGIRFLDTAQSYGKSEYFIGKALSELKNKDSVKVVSKLSPELQKCSPNLIYESVEHSLQRLEIKQFEGFMAHRTEVIYSENFSLAIDKLKDKGLIINSGVSVYTPDEALMVIENPMIDILQIPFNILDRRWIDKGVLAKAEEYNVQLFFRSIFLQGLIFLNNYDLMQRKMIWAKPYLDQFHKLVSKTSLSAIELSIKVLSEMCDNHIIIFGLDNFQQLQANIEIINDVKINKVFSEKWWSSIPLFPEKLLNPALWN